MQGTQATFEAVMQVVEDEELRLGHDKATDRWVRLHLVSQMVKRLGRPDVLKMKFVADVFPME